MSDDHIQLRKIVFKGLTNSELELTHGVNVVCGASDTGKSFLAEAIDYMLGGSELRDIPEVAKYGEIELSLDITNGESWRLNRATTGGNFALTDLSSAEQNDLVLKQKHAHAKVDNISGFLLSKIGLLGKRVLKSSTKGTTRSLSFRDVARLVIVQEGEIQERQSPFWTGQFTTKTSELATAKLLLTGIDDSSVVAAPDSEPGNEKQIALIDELLSDLSDQIEDSGEDKGELALRLVRLDESIAKRRLTLDFAQRRLESILSQRRTVLNDRRRMQDRAEEIAELLARFDLLKEHYVVDIGRLQAIHESGALFVHLDISPCPVCGAAPDAQHRDTVCDGDIDAVVIAANSEIKKIERLIAELDDTVSDLTAEQGALKDVILAKDSEYGKLEDVIQESAAPDVRGLQASFEELIEERANARKLAEIFTRRELLERRRTSLLDEDQTGESNETVKAGIPDSAAHALSTKISKILLAWNFPGQCHVYFDKDSSDFVIDGKQRANRGKGLRAITHAAVNVALLEYCQEKGLSHPGFVVLDSPLLAYFKPEGDDDVALKGTDLKEKFYEYLVKHHGENSQVLIIENQHPPEAIEKHLSLTVFTGNPAEGRFGLL